MKEKKKERREAQGVLKRPPKEVDNNSQEIDSYKTFGEKSITRKELVINLRDLRLSGKTGLGTRISLEVLPKREIILARRKKLKRNPDRVHVWTWEFDQGSFSIVYYKNWDTFWRFIHHGVHRYEREIPTSMLLYSIAKMLYVFKHRKSPRGRSISKVLKQIKDLLEVI